jgi:hypothetical protein
MFRYEELGMGVRASNIYLCPFQICPDRFDPNDPVHRALAGGTDATKEMDLATLQRLYESKYSFPKYLPHESIMEFVREGKLAHTTPIKRITQVMKPEHVFRFEKRWKELRAIRGDSVVPRLAYHGTAAANVKNILEKGLLVPGSKTGVAHATDTGESFTMHFPLPLHPTPSRDLPLLTHLRNAHKHGRLLGRRDLLVAKLPALGGLLPRGKPAAAVLGSDGQDLQVYRDDQRETAEVGVR